MSLKAMIWVMEEAPVENHGELAVLYALADRADENGRAAWPSQEWLSYRARCTDRTVRNHLSKLEDRGVIERGDYRLVDHFPRNRRPIVWNLNMSLTRPEKWRPENISGRKILTPRPENPDTLTGKSEQLDRKQVSDKPSLTIHEPSMNHPTESLEFDEFWRAYPRKAGKRNAQTKFEEQVNSGASTDDLVKAATNYRAETERAGTETRYIPHPSTFLNQERWRDYLKAPAMSAADKRRATIEKLENLEL